jgi:hypothetical protein
VPAKRYWPAVTAAVGAIAVAAGCLTITPADAVSGTPITTGELTFTAKLDIGSGEQHRACSGALVAPQWIITSPSCFSSDPETGSVAGGAPQFKTTATIGRTNLTTTAGTVSEVVELVPRADRDVVMARLAAPVAGVAPVALADRPVAAGDTLRTAGYGRTADTWVPDQLHTADFTVDSVAETTTAITGASAADSLCSGDAGGPVLRATDNGYELVAVATRGWQGGCLGSSDTRNNAIAARVDNTVIGSRIEAGTTLLPGDTLTANAAKLSMKADGNLVITSNAGKTLWSTGTAGNPGAVAVFDANGNLTLRTADRATTLWETKTSAPGGYAKLQDRGNFVIYNANNESQWAAGTVIRHDYNGDGRSDMAAWYDYSDRHDALHTFKAAADGTIQQPFQSYASAVGSWAAENMQFSTGDYNGDGRGDMAALYGYSDGSVKLYTALGKADGGFAAPFSSWSAAAGRWTAKNMTLHSGDFDGDGRDDLAAWYDYDNGDDKLFTFTANTTGGFDPPFSSWSNTNNDWNRSNLKFVSGDWNADGRDDLGGLYRYSDGSIRMFSFLTTGAGGFQASIASWSSSTFGDWSGRDDVAAWYDYSDGHDAIHVLTSTSTPDGHFNTPVLAYQTASGNFTYSDMRIIPGDYNGDGLDDLAAIYGYSDGSVRMFTWTTRTDGKINGAVPGWTSATTSSWNINLSTFLRSAN